jgi:hypothetical protein
MIIVVKRKFMLGRQLNLELYNVTCDLPNSSFKVAFNIHIYKKPSNIQEFQVVYFVRVTSAQIWALIS